MTIEEFLAQKYSYNDSVKANWKSYTDLWKDWYKGYNETFHRYTIYNGRNEIPMKRHTLNMAKKACEDWSDSLFNERCSITLSNMEQNKVLQDVLTELNFWEFSNRAIEKAFALGTGAIVLSLDNIIDTGSALDVSDTKANLSYVEVDNIYPISWNNNKITECAFMNESVSGGKTICVVSVHKKDESTGNYVIDNYMFTLDGENNIIEEVPLNNVLKKFNTGSDKPWFVIITPNSNNNFQENSPFGVSIFANSIDTLESIDIGFDTFINEISLSRKRIFVRDELLDYGADGKSHPVFHASDIAVYTLPSGMDKDDMIQSENSNIRSESLEKYLKNMLALYSDSIGFDTNFYTFDNNTAVKTATEVISDNNKMFRRKKKHEILLESALYDLISCICYALSVFGTYNLTDEGLTIKFDDSIVENVGAIAERSLKELNNGIISVVEYRERIFGESYDLAKQKYLEVLEENREIPRKEEVDEINITNINDTKDLPNEIENDIM